MGHFYESLCLHLFVDWLTGSALREIHYGLSKLINYISKIDTNLDYFSFIASMCFLQDIIG